MMWNTVNKDSTSAILAMKERREDELVDERRKVKLPRRAKSQDELDYKNKGQHDDRREPERESVPGVCVCFFFKSEELLAFKL